MRDLDGLIVTEIPWLVTPDAPEFAESAAARILAARRSTGSTRSGSTHFASRAAFRDGPPDRFELDGATGHITLETAANSRAKAASRVYRDGKLVPLDGPRAEAADRVQRRARRGARRAIPRAARGLTIVARNFRTRRGEIDLIARDGDTLVFVEVRLRRARDFGGAAASITAAKRAR